MPSKTTDIDIMESKSRFFRGCQNLSNLEVELPPRNFSQSSLGIRLFPVLRPVMTRKMSENVGGPWDVSRLEIQS